MRVLLRILLLFLSPLTAFAQAGRLDSTLNGTGKRILPLTSSFYFGSLEKGACLVRQDSTHWLYLYPLSTALSDDYGLLRLDADGNLDPSFGQNGQVSVDVAGPLNDAPAVVQVLGGKIYLGGQAGDANVAIVRLLANGRLDSTFSNDGKLTIDFGKTNERAVAFGLTTSGAPRLHIAVSTDSAFGLAILKAADGSLDRSFSGDGLQTFNVGKGRCLGAYFEPNGGLDHLAGYSKTSDTAQFQFTVYKVAIASASGSIKRFRLTRGPNICNAVTVNGSNEMLLAGECRDNATGRTYAGVLSYRPATQTENANFATQGRFLWRSPAGIDAAAHAIRVRPIGSAAWQILVGGVLTEGGTESGVMFRLDQNGYLDSQFGDHGISQVRFGQIRERISDLDLMGSGLDERLILAGQGMDGLLWGRMKINNPLPRAAGWFPVPAIGKGNFKSIRSTTDARVFQLVGDSGRMHRFIKTENTAAPDPIFSWQQLSAGAGRKTLRDFKNNANADFWVVGDTGFLATTASGLHNSWVRRRTATKQRINAIHSESFQLGIACGDSGLILRSTNLGTTITKINSRTRRRLNQVYARSLIVGDSGTILKSTDEGVTWTRRASSTLKHLHSVAAPAGSPFLIVGDSGLILRSTDLGETWGAIANADTNDLYSVSIGYMTLACGANGTILKSEDEGLTWRRMETGTVQHMRSILSDDVGQATCVGDSGTVLRTLDGGLYVPNRPIFQKNKPLELSLYPNPACRSVSIRAELPKSGMVRVEVLDLAGKMVAVEEDHLEKPGAWSGRLSLGTNPPGCYLVRVSNGGQSGLRKLIVE